MSERDKAMELKEVVVVLSELRVMLERGGSFNDRMLLKTVCDAEKKWKKMSAKKRQVKVRRGRISEQDRKRGCRKRVEGGQRKMR